MPWRGGSRSYTGVTSGSASEEERNHSGSGGILVGGGVVGAGNRDSPRRRYVPSKIL